jgi:hypothetical protein
VPFEVPVAVTVQPYRLVTCPLLAGIGATPSSIANAASEMDAAWVKPGAQTPLPRRSVPTPHSSSRSKRQHRAVRDRHEAPFDALASLFHGGFEVAM